MGDLASMDHRARRFSKKKQTPTKRDVSLFIGPADIGSDKVHAKFQKRLSIAEVNCTIVIHLTVHQAE